jgi:hypothetical protein
MTVGKDQPAEHTCIPSTSYATMPKADDSIKVLISASFPQEMDVVVGECTRFTGFPSYSLTSSCRAHPEVSGSFRMLWSETQHHHYPARSDSSAWLGRKRHVLIHSPGVDMGATSRERKKDACSIRLGNSAGVHGQGAVYQWRQGEFPSRL